MMFNPMRKGWAIIAHPYNFIFKEGKDIQKNPFDYTLMMMALPIQETLSSPAREPASAVAPTPPQAPADGKEPLQI